MGFVTREDTPPFSISPPFGYTSRENSDSFRLCHYFDLIVGTSTGSIIGTFLAAGLRVADIEDLYLELAGKVFPKKTTGQEQATARKGLFSSEKLQQLIDQNLRRIDDWPQHENCTLASAPLKTGLGIVVRRLDDDHTWLVHNNRKAKYYVQDRHIPLAQWVVASSSAPPFFDPHLIKLRTSYAAFADGGLSAFNNPSLAALIVATLKHKIRKKENGILVETETEVDRGFGWALGQDKLMLVSVGTGWLKQRRDSKHLVEGAKGFHISLAKKVKDSLVIRLGDSILQGFMGDANFLTQAMLLWMSNSKTRTEVHGAAQDLLGEFLHPNALNKPEQHFLTYLRYDVGLHDSEAYPHNLLPLTNERRDEYYDFVNGNHVKDLLEIGRECGRRYVKESQFECFTPDFWP